MNSQKTAADITAIDLISLYEIYRSRQKEQEANEFTDKLIHALAVEVEKLHKANEVIIEQNKEIIKLLRRK